MELPIFDMLTNQLDDKLHPKYLLLRDNFQLLAERHLIQSYTEGLVDRDKKMVQQFKETFHSTYWEIILYQVCLEAGFSLDQKHPFPDFIVSSPIELYIEAVVSNIKQSGLSESNRTYADQSSMLTPPRLQADFSSILNESIIRSSNAIFSKIHKYDSYKKGSWFNENAPFVIALSSFDQVNYGREFIYSMMALLYGQYYVPSLNGCISKKTIIKPETNISLPLGIFLSSQYSQVSAILFSCTNTIGKLTALSLSQGLNPSNGVLDIIRDETDNELPFKFKIVGPNSPECVSDGIFMCHNPYAQSPINPKIFEKTNITHLILENGILKICGQMMPLYTRFCASSCLLNPLLETLINDLAIQWNSQSLFACDDFLGSDLSEI